MPRLVEFEKGEVGQTGPPRLCAQPFPGEFFCIFWDFRGFSGFWHDIEANKLR